MLTNLSSAEFPHYGSLLNPLDAGFRQSSILMGVSLIFVGIIFFPGTILLLQGEIAAGDNLWIEYLFPLLCLLGSGVILLSGIVCTIDAQYRQRSMRCSGKLTRAKILGFYLDNDGDLGTIRYMVYEFDALGPAEKAGRYTLREAVSDDLFHRLQNQEFALVQYVPRNPTIATLNFSERFGKSFR